MTQPPDPSNPFGMFGGAGGDLFAQLQKLMSWTGGPVNWDLAREVAESSARAEDRPVTAAETREIADAGRLADHWLDAATTLPASGTELAAWSRTDWLTSTLHPWRQLVDPVAGQVTAALGNAFQGQLTGDNLPPELAGLLGGAGGANPLAGMMNQIGGFLFGAQVGQALGSLAGEVLSTSEVGLPLGKPALVPLNVVIVYWNFVLDGGVVEWTFGALSIVFNALLAWPWRRYFWPLLVWRGRPDYALEPGRPLL